MECFLMLRFHSDVDGTVFRIADRVMRKTAVVAPGRIRAGLYVSSVCSSGWTQLLLLRAALGIGMRGVVLLIVSLTVWLYATNRISTKRHPIGCLVDPIG